MTQPIERDPIYRGRRFQTETIELCVRWYITYRLSYRDLAAMMAERGIVVSHTTIMRWVLRYVPEYERRWDRYATTGEFLLAHGRDSGFASGAVGTICIARSTNTESPSVRCCERIAAWKPRRSSSARRSLRTVNVADAK